MTISTNTDSSAPLTVRRRRRLKNTVDFGFAGIWVSPLTTVIMYVCHIIYYF